MHDLLHDLKCVKINKNKDIVLYNDNAHLSIWRGFYKIIFEMHIRLQHTQ